MSMKMTEWVDMGRHSFPSSHMVTQKHINTVQIQKHKKLQSRKVKYCIWMLRIQWEL